MEARIQSGALPAVGWSGFALVRLRRSIVLDDLPPELLFHRADVVLPGILICIPLVRIGAEAEYGSRHGSTRRDRPMPWRGKRLRGNPFGPRHGIPELE